MVDNIKDYYEHVKENCLIVFKTGSCLLSYLDFYRDIDYVFLYDTEEHAQQAKIYFKSLYNIIDIHKNKRIDIHFRSLEKYLDIWGFTNEIKIIIGNKDIKTKLPDLFKDTIKAKEFIIETITKNKSLYIKNPRMKFYNMKSWYYLYRIYSILKNNSYELTNEQKRIINILHNVKEEDKEMRKQIIDNLIQEVESWPL